jgi:hypothetical protein
MGKPKSKKRKIFLFYKEKCLVGLTPGENVNQIKNKTKTN